MSKKFRQHTKSGHKFFTVEKTGDAWRVFWEHENGECGWNWRDTEKQALRLIPTGANEITIEGETK